LSKFPKARLNSLALFGTEANGSTHQQTLTFQD